MALTEERRAALLAYCKLTELADDPEVAAVIPVLYDAAGGDTPAPPVRPGPPSTTWGSTPWCWTPGTAGT